MSTKFLVQFPKAPPRALFITSEHRIRSNKVVPLPTYNLHIQQDNNCIRGVPNWLVMVIIALELLAICILIGIYG